MRFNLRGAVSLFAFCVALGATLAAHAQGSDYAREKRWAAEIAPTLLAGEAVSLRAAKHEFLGLYAAVARAKGAIVLAHGAGIHPDYGLIGSLRARLADAGYATLAIQMPILAADAPAARYAALFPEADARLAAALAYLRGKGHGKIALLSHSMGARMANHFLASNPRAALSAWIALSISGGEFAPFGKPKFPVFDIYAEKDLEPVLRGAAARARFLRRLRGSSQTLVFGADHFYAGKEKELTSLIVLLLEGEKK